MTDLPLLDSNGFPLPLPPDPPGVVPDEVERALEAYRAGDVPEARALLRATAESGRTVVACHAAAALAGIELAEDEPDEPAWKLLEQVAAGEDPWLGPLAAVLPTAGLYAAFESLDVGQRPVDDPLVRGLVAQLTGDLEAARAGFEQAATRTFPEEWTTDLANALLGNLLLTGPDPAAAEEPLAKALKSDHELYAGYAGYLLGHLLIGRNDLDRAAEALQAAQSVSHPAKAGREGLYPWLCVRLGELVASGGSMLDLVDEQMERSGVSESYVVRNTFEGASYFTEVSRPALAEIGLFMFPGDFETVRAALERLRTWGDERYDRARRLCLTLYRYVSDPGDADHSRALAALMTELDLPRY
ncbi:hypothetical protein GCM10023196_104790 [Actinoallomurus vinaceus]|uniref:Tetratricopeptide repeat protein n=1 Tax=Actinoallomurus vinaceus TaxID=1080074 RepID=A0ABP8UWC2_9ACTN